MARQPVRRVSLDGVHCLTSRNLSLDAVNSIRHLILSGRFPPSTHLVEAHLASALGVSHGTIRAALLQLRYEGLVEYHHNRGVFVRELTSRDAREIYSLRNTLEAAATRLVAARVTDHTRQTLRRILAQMRAAVQAADKQAAIESDFEFHRSIVALSDHRLLVDHYHLLELQTRLFMVVTELLHPDLSHMIPYHEPLVEAIAAGDGNSAERLAAQHNTIDGEKLAAYLEQREAEVRV
jgi:DNA-binding GntR family transcriptional regulator